MNGQPLETSTQDTGMQRVAGSSRQVPAPAAAGGGLQGRWFVPPQSRFRLYGSPANYVSVAADLLRGRVTGGDAVGEVEARVAQLVGVRRAVAMPQARVGLFLLIRTLVKPGQNVVMSPYTIHDVVNMVICAGGRPVFADIERQTCNIDPAEVARLVDERTGAVLVTHLHGLACPIEAIAAICRERNVPLLEDTAQAFGGRVAGRRLGSFGTAGIYSFGMAKNINSFYGGMVVTDDAGLAERLRAELEGLPYQSTDFLLKRVAFALVGDVATWRPVFGALTFWVYRYGHLNGIDAITNRWRGEDEPRAKQSIPPEYLRRMTATQARLVERALPEVDRDSEARIAAARRYHEGLRDLGEILLPPMREDGSHIYLSFPIQVPDRHGLLRFLTERGRDLSVQHIGNNADYACFQEFQRDCPNARRTAAEVLLLPTYPRYARSEIDKNISLIRAYFGR